MKLTRRLAVVTTVAATVLALAACTDSAEETPETGAAAESSDAAASEGTFPATVTTAFGDVTVEEAPQRVVALGWGDAEVALSVGVQPVGASDWMGFGGEGVGPWSEGLYDEAPEIIETMEPSFEAVAALEPDLILDVKSSGDQERYDRLSSIAPTIGIPEGGENWMADTEQQTTMITTALGFPEEGAAQLEELDQAFTEATEAHPDWAGQTTTAATHDAEGWGAYIEGSSRVEFLEKLGFVLSPTIAEMEPGETGFSVDVSDEQLDLLDADLLVAFPIFVEVTEITEDPQWQAIPAVADGRSVVIDGELSDAYSLGTPTAQLYAIDELTPLIEDALG